MQKITSKILWVHESGNDNALLSLITYSFYQRMGCEGASMQAYMQFAVAHVGVREKCILKYLWDVYERANLFWGCIGGSHICTLLAAKWPEFVILQLFSHILKHTSQVQRVTSRDLTFNRETQAA